jgi:hypothetical protein
VVAAGAGEPAQRLTAPHLERDAGGNLHQSRRYSLYLARQLKARYEGLPTPVYRLAESHHSG